MKKVIVITVLIVGSVNNIAKSLFSSQNYRVRGNTPSTAGQWHHRDKYYRGPRNEQWSGRRNYDRGYVRADAYPANNREYYASDGYTRF